MLTLTRTLLPRVTTRRMMVQAMVSCLVLTAVSSCKPKDQQQQRQQERQQRESSSRAQKDNRVKIAILADTHAIPLRNYQCALLERLILTRPAMAVERYSAAGDPVEQARQIRDAKASGAKFIILFPLDASIVAPASREAISGGVRVIALSANLPEDAYTASIYCDDRQLGAMAADFILQALKAKAAEEGLPAPVGRVVQLRGDDESSMATERALGFTEALQREPGVVLVHDAPAGWDENNAAARIREALRLQKQFDVVYAHNDLMAAGAARQLSESSMEMRGAMLVIGTDAVPGATGGASLVNKGVLDATIFYPPLVDVAWRDIERVLDDPSYVPKKRQRVKPILITPSNAADFERQPLPRPRIE